ncbi:MAG: helix-turn-helix domain-containing protein [Desulfobacteraceae bacterium]|nr:helix-turn-helix domain-containing protein [Desulfobacteraceae bacterium]
MSPVQLKSYMSRYKITTAKLAGLLGLTRNHIHHMRSGIDSVPPWIETAVKEIADGHYKKKPDGLDDKTRDRLEGQLAPYLQQLTEKAHHGYYQFF